MSSRSKSRSWNEQEKIVEACAATMLYRKRRNARLLTIPSSLDDLIKRNQLVRLENMIKQLLPASKFRKGRSCSETNSVSNSFEEFIYNPIRDGSKIRHRLYRDISRGQEVFPVQVYSDTKNCDRPEEFTYISSNDYSELTKRCCYEDDEAIIMVTCDCSDSICGEKCSCRQMNDHLTTCTIMGDGRVFVNSDANFFNTLIVGCGGKCACKGQCRNTLSSVCLPAPFKFEIFRRNDKVGFGLRTLSNIPHGCAVVEFCGEVIDQKCLTKRGTHSLDYAFCLQTVAETELCEKLASARNAQREIFHKWDENFYIDPTRKGNIARFLSHGCFPNLIMLRYAENDLRLHRSHAILFANQPILGGSELFFDYGNQYLSRTRFKCRCRTLLCESVAKSWQSSHPSYGEITSKSFAYFDYIERRMLRYDSKARQYLRDKGIVKPEHDDLDEVCSSEQKGPPRVDPICLHRRDGDNAPVICYNLYCRGHSKCTCKTLAKVITTITID